MTSNILSTFLAERVSGKTDFAKFLAEDEKAKGLIHHVVRDFEKYLADGNEIDSKYKDNFLMILTQRNSFLMANGFDQTDVNLVLLELSEKLLDPGDHEMAADVVFPPVAVRFIAFVTNKEVRDVMKELPDYFERPIEKGQ